MESMELLEVRVARRPLDSGAAGKGRPAVFCWRMRLIFWPMFCCSTRACWRLMLAMVRASLSRLKRVRAAWRLELELLTVWTYLLPWTYSWLREDCSAGRDHVRALMLA